MSELQAEAAEPVQAETATNEQPVEASDSAPDSGENHEQKITFSDEQQRIVDDIAAKKTFKIREAEREAEKLRQQLEEARSQLPQETRPDVPPIPDAFEDDYEAKVLARDKQVLAAAQFDANEQARQSQAQQIQLQEQQQQQRELAEKAQAYSANATKKGINSAELQAAGAAVANYGIREDVTMEMLSDVDGPAITVYLSANPQAIDALNSASPISLGAVYADIKSKASGIGARLPTTPDPVDTLSGSGVPPKKRGAAGTTFE